MMRKIILIAIYITFQGCVDITKNIMYSANDQKFQTYKKEFENNLLLHFPKGVDENFIDLDFGYSSPKRGFIYLVLTNKYKEANIKKQIDNIEKIESMSPCLMIVCNKIISASFNKYTHKDCLKNLHPIPDLNSIYFKDKDVKIPSDIEYYIIESKAGLFFETNEDFTQECLPEEWKHGYSRGVSISKSKNIIFYWVMTW